MLSRKPKNSLTQPDDRRKATETAMANGLKNGNGAPQRFGSCCEELAEAIAGEDFEPLITVGADGILYAAVGLIEFEDSEPGMIDHPMFFCPFCGTKLQDAEVVRAQIASVGQVQQ